MASDTQTKKRSGNAAPKKAAEPEICKKDKLCILGTAGSMPMAPFGDESFEIWGVSPVVTYEQCKRYDVLFELHGRGYWERPDILDRLRATDKPIYMHDRYEEIPQSIKFPIDDVTQYGRYHTTSISYMLALAMHSYLATGKPYHVAIFGVHMEHAEEYERQRPCVEYWVGRMQGAGIDVFIPPGGALMATYGLYGYENYNPLCYDIKARIQGLQLGEQHCEAQRNEWEGKRHQQIGAAKEAQYWLDILQKGGQPQGVDNNG